MSLRFEVTAEKPKINSNWAVSAGRTPTTFPFSVIPPKQFGSAYNVERDFLGEMLNRAIRLEQNGPTVVEVSMEWIGKRSTIWRDEIVDLALEPFATPSLGICSVS
jgi:hypothetical protein